MAKTSLNPLLPNAAISQKMIERLGKFKEYITNKDKKDTEPVRPNIPYQDRELKDINNSYLKAIKYVRSQNIRNRDMPKKIYPYMGDAIKLVNDKTRVATNEKNFDTLALQRELSNRGYKLPKSTKEDGDFDGIWGDETKNALLDYQSKNNYAEMGLTNATKGTDWKIVKDFKGQPKHSQGGVDITISDNGVSMRRGGKDIKAKFGLLIPATLNVSGTLIKKVKGSKLNPKNWGVPDYTDKGSRGAAFAAARKAGEKAFMWNNTRYHTSIKNENPYQTGTYESKLIPTTYLSNRLNTASDKIIRDKAEYNLNEGKLFFSRTGEVTDGNIIIGGDYMEETPTALPAYNYKNAVENIKYTRNKQIPLDKENQLFYGVINNKLKTGKISDFMDDDVIVPIRFGGSYDKTTPISEEDNKLLDIEQKIKDERVRLFFTPGWEDSKEYKEFLKNNPKKRRSMYDERKRFMDFYDSELTKELIRETGLSYPEYKEKIAKIKEDNFVFKRDGKGIYSSGIGGKIILHSNKSGKQLYLFKNSRNEIIEKSQKFLEENPDAEFISMDTGRYNFMLENKDGLKEEDFIKYSSADLKRGNKLGYNIIFEPHKYRDYGDGIEKRVYYSDEELQDLDVESKNFDTLALQRELSNRGYKLPKSTKEDGDFDGIWGDETKKALLDYQSQNNK